MGPPEVGQPSLDANGLVDFSVYWAMPPTPDLISQQGAEDFSANVISRLLSQLFGVYRAKPDLCCRLLRQTCCRWQDGLPSQNISSPRQSCLDAQQWRNKHEITGSISSEQRAISSEIYKRSSLCELLFFVFLDITAYRLL